jgi:hypothetical protein
MLWEHFLTGEELTQSDIQDMLANTDLVEWREVTDEEIEESEDPLEEGEIILALSDKGKEIWDKRKVEE